MFPFLAKWKKRSRSNLYSYTAMDSSVRTIYTIGHQPLRDLNEFISCLKRHDLNCVVDVRPLPELESLGVYCSNELSSILKTNDITYLTFREEFSVFSAELFKQKGELSYKKVTKSDLFLKGIGRLANGIDKGFRIVLLGTTIDPLSSFRYNYIGKYLSDSNWNVYHILSDGNAYTHQLIADNIERAKIKRQAHIVQAKKLGRTGELIAADYLANRGYTILERNWNLFHGCELDIIAFKDNKIHAVEVKTRSNDELMEPQEAIGREKMKHITKAVVEYKYRRGLYNTGTQVDCIAILYHSDDDYSVTMFEDLIMPSKRKF